MFACCPFKPHTQQPINAEWAHPGQMWPVVCNNHCQPTHCWLSSVDKDTPGVTNHREGPWMIWSMEQASAYRAGPMTLGRWKSDVGAQRWVHGCASVTIALKGNLTFRAWLLSPVTPGGLGNHFVNPGHLGNHLWLWLLSGHPGPPQAFRDSCLGSQGWPTPVQSVKQTNKHLKLAKHSLLIVNYYPMTTW